jgi:hypothetical protein
VCVTNGSAIIELAPALLLLFIFFFFPLLSLSTSGVRYVFLVNAAHRAALAASQAKSFLVNTSPTDLSAVNLAQQIATQDAAAFTGITLTKTNTSIVIAPSNGSTPTRQTAPLAKPADTINNSYDVEVRLVASLQPLIQGSFPAVRIPGLSAPMTVTTRADVVFENTQGLTQ